MSTLWLVRHGETQSNLDRVFQGQLDTVLTDQGIEQAQAVARALSCQEFDAVYSSDLQRTAQTAREIVGERYEVTLDPRLREMHYGVLQGIPFANFRSVLAEHGVAETWGPGIFSQNGMAAPGGESIAEMRERLVSFVEDLERNHPLEQQENLLVVSHGGTLRLLMTILLQLPVETRQSFAFANCSITRLILDGDQPRLDCHNVVVWGDSPIGPLSRH